MTRKILTVAEVRERLRKDINGDVAAWAKKHDVSGSYVYAVLSGDKSPSTRLCKALGIRREIGYWFEN